MSVNKTRQEIERNLDEVRACLRRVIGKHGEPVQGRVRVKGTIDFRGRLTRLAAKGGLPGAGACVEQGLNRARMPRPDTGEAYVELTLGYRAR